jgi:YVTN family beta-propeller protein
VKLIALAFVAALAAAPTLKVNVGESTFGLASSGGYLWAGGLALGDVLRIDPASGRVVGRTYVGARVFNLASAPGAVWAVGNISRTATRIDTRSSKVTATVHVGNGPYDIGWGFGSAWVSNSADGTVSRITGKKVVKTIKVGVEPNGLSAIGRFLYVTDHTAGRVIRIDPNTNRVTASVSLAGADWVTGNNGSLYVSQETNVVTRVDARTLKVTGNVKVKRNPLGSAIVKGRLWVPCIDSGTIVVVDPASMKIVRELPAGQSPILALPVDGHVWVSHANGTSLWRF